MSDLLANAKQHRDLVLLAEIGALIHDLGKLSWEFVGEPSDYHSQILRRFADARHPYFSSPDEVRQCLLGWIERDLEKAPQEDQAVLRTLLDEAREKPDVDLFHLARWFAEAASGKLTRRPLRILRRQYLGPLLGEAAINDSDEDFLPQPLRDLLDDTEFARRLEDPLFEVQQRALGDSIALHHATLVEPKPRLVQLLKAPDGADGFDSSLDKQQPDGQQDRLEGRPSQTHVATAFGYEGEQLALDELRAVRHQFAEALVDALGKVREGQATPDQVRPDILNAAEEAFRQGLGETRRPANDVTLWDHAYSAASLYKAALAKVLIEQKWTEPAQIHWRILRVSFDGLGFWSQAHHVTDLLRRRDAVEEGLDAVRQELEVALALGNEVYRDENGSAFLMPDLGENHGELEQTVRQAVLDAISSTDLAGELVPECHWHPDPVRDEMASAFGQALREAPRPLAGDPAVVAAWWKWKEAPNREICTVCGLRPVGFAPEDAQIELWATAEKAQKRHVCRVCLQRRGRRAKEWWTKEPQNTIWADEVADVNGRFALIVGRFELDIWLDGTLVRTMLVKEGESKNPSPARIRRVWQTTERFWQEVEEVAIPDILTPRPRLAIVPAKPKDLEELGQYHAYQLDLGGPRLGVVWDGSKLIVTESLRDLARRLGLPKKDWEDDDSAANRLVEWLNGQPRPWPLLEPSGYGTSAAETGCRVEEVKDVRQEERKYTPHIPLLTEPALFMALVPADRAMEVVLAIKAKYEEEMGKVRDRLPLHLGVVVAQRRTPLRAVLEAGRALLERESVWQEWQVEQKHADGVQEVRLTLSHDGRVVEWSVPTKMGDGETPDAWYPYLLQRPLAAGERPNAASDLVRVGDLVEENTFYALPSSFDFEYLDTTARRFEVSYGADGRRRGRPSRPCLLEEVEVLKEVWTLLGERLTTSQWMTLDGLIEQKRREWDERPGALSPTFEQLVRDALRNAEWKRQGQKGWRAALDEGERELLEDAALRGVLSDAINLYHWAMKEEKKKREE